MVRIAVVFLISLAVGWALSLQGLPWPVQPGFIGVGILIAAAFAARAWWAKRAVTGDDPGPPERETWHALVGYSVIAGHMVGGLSQRTDLHVGAGNTLALDSWLLVAGAVAAYLIVRSRDRTRDERDHVIQNRGNVAGYWSLCGSIVILSLYLAFIPPPGLDGFTHFFIANLIIGLIVVSEVVKQLTRLIAYGRGHRQD